MSLLYHIVPRKNPQKADAPHKYYIQLVKRGHIDFDKLMLRACEETTLNPNELRMGIDRAFTKAEEYLEEGFTVGFNRLGYVKVDSTSEGSETEEEATPDKVKRTRLHFKFGKDILDRLQRVGFEKKK